MRTTLIIPCFDEEARLDVEALRSLVTDDISLLCVDDGSTDGTRAVLAELARSDPDRIEVLALDANVGKAEAVRAGLVAAIDAGRSTFVGYFDADLATPVHEMQRLVALASSGTVDVIVGSRVALVGHHIERRPLRHYLGRVFGTLASLALRLTIYDTQCGAKLFRVTPELAESVREPFLSRWVFDVELLGRLLAAGVPEGAIWEEPLREWRDVRGSKLDTRQVTRAVVDLVRIARDLAGRRTINARSR